MDFKLFGAGGPNDRLIEDLRFFLSLDDRQRELLSEWVNASTNLYPETWEDLDGLSQGLRMSGRDTSRVVGVTRYVLSNWRSKKLTLQEVLGDLKSVGLDEEHQERAAKFFSVVGDAREKVHKAALRRLYEQMALPTIDDVNITWDLRPLFESVAYTPTAESAGYDSMIGTVHVLLLEISASRSDGQRASQTYQLSEDEFERLLSALNRAKKQLEVFKKRVL